MGRVVGALTALIGGAILLAGCSRGSSSPPIAAFGTLKGILEVAGGPSPGSPRPLNGTVSIQSARGEVMTLKVDPDGKFSARVHDGSYTVTGRSPLYGGGKANCESSGSVIVTGGATTRVVVTCQES